MSGRRWIVLALAAVAALAAGLWLRRPTPLPTDPVAPDTEPPPATTSLIGDMPIPSCGDDQLELGETCDPPGESLACSQLVPNAVTGRAVCNASCVWDLSACLSPDALCGNGRVEAGELCDDGNRLSGDGCDATCAVEVDGLPVHYDGPSADALVERATRGSPCRDADVRRDARRGASVRVEYELIVCQLPGGVDVFPVDRLREALADVRLALRPAGIELAEDRLTRVRSTDCRVRFGGRELREHRFDPTRPALPVFFFRSVSGSEVSGMDAAGFAAFGHGAVLATTRPDVIVHEIGHALGLLHTHACLGEGGDCDETGDGLCDTPYDPGPAWLPHRCGGRPAEVCDPACGAGPCSGGAEPDRSNPMGYFSGCRDDFSPDQLDRMRCVLDHELAWLRASDACGSELCNGRDDDCDGDVDEDAACDAECGPVEPLSLGRTAGSTHGGLDTFGGDLSGQLWPEGTPDRLFELRPSAPGDYCLAVRGAVGAAAPIIALLDGCSWRSAVLASNLTDRAGPQPGAARARSSPHLDVWAGPGEPAFISVDGWGRSDGIDYVLDVGRGRCERVDRLTAPRLLAPGPGRVTGAPVDLSWEPVSGAEAYEVRLGGEPVGLLDDPPCRGCDAQIVETTRVSLQGLPASRVVHWTVRALRGSETGPFAPRRAFEVARDPDEPPLGAPRLLEPRRDAVVPTLTESFSWTGVEGATAYEFRLGLNASSITDEACDECLVLPVAATTVEPTPAVMGPDIDYAWTVRAVRVGELGPFAPVRRFSVDDWLCTRVGRLAVPDARSSGTFSELGRPQGDDGGTDLEATCGGSSSFEHVWLLVPGEAGRVCVDTAGSELDTVLSARRRCERAETEVVCNDEGFEQVAGPSRIELDVAAGEALFVIVDGFEPGDVGRYGLHVEPGACP